MCGLVGMAGALQQDHKSIFKDMLTVSQFRGRDATGVIKVSPDQSYSFVKNIGTPEYLFDTRQYDRTIDTGPAMALIGHTRAKTVGLNSIKNAHPFQFNHVCGVHNGTLRDDWSLEDRRSFDVDSEALYYNIDRHGVEETLPKVTGAWCLVWWDDDEKTLNFIRNSERPLFFTWSADHKVMYWASEKWMFNVIARRAGHKLWDGGEEKDPFMELPEDTHWRFRINHAAKGDEKVMTGLQPRTIKGKEVRSHSGNAYGNGGARHTTSTVNGQAGYWAHGKFHPYVDKPEDKGGQVANPFQQGNSPAAVSARVFLDTILNDPIDDIARDDPPSSVILLPDGSRDTSKTPEEPTTTSTTSSKSSKSSQNVLDIRPASLRTRSSERKTLSLVSPTSNCCPQDNNDGSSRKSSEPSSKPAPKKQVSVRTVADMLWITDHKTGSEYSEAQFEQNTNACCTFCKSPVGDFSEVSEFFDNGNRFICTTCDDEPMNIKVYA